MRHFEPCSKNTLHNLKYHLLCLAVSFHLFGGNFMERVVKLKLGSLRFNVDPLFKAHQTIERKCIKYFKAHL